MSCMISIERPCTTLKFLNKHKQKIWIDALLRYGALDLCGLSELLDLDKDILLLVHRGVIYLKAHEAERLATLLLTLFGE